MKINYSDQEIIKGEKSIYLVGPTSGDKNIPSWRLEACKYLEEIGFDGVVYVPEISTKEKEKGKNQERWERHAILESSIICFWIPKEIENDLYTDTDLDFGYWFSTNKVIYGTNAQTKTTRYLDWLYRLDYKKDPENNLEDLLNKSVMLANTLYKNDYKELKKIKNRH